jgi:hypothetical protein
MVEQNDPTISYLTQGVNVANDLIEKALTSDWDAFVDYAYELLSCEYESKDIKKFNRFLNKICAMRNELAAELHHTRVPDSRQIPMSWQQETRVIPDMSSGRNGERLMRGVSVRADFNPARAEDVIDSDR